jgi:hypothetical protein
MRKASASTVIAVAEPETYENGSLMPLERKDSTANAIPNGRLDHVSPMSRLKTLARPEGFEPPTLGSEDRCSGPLSYGRAARA